MIKDYHGKVAELRDAVFGQSIRLSLPRGELPVLRLDKVAGIQHLGDQTLSLGARRKLALARIDLLLEQFYLSILLCQGILLALLEGFPLSLLCARFFAPAGLFE